MGVNSSHNDSSVNTDSQISITCTSTEDEIEKEIERLSLHTQYLVRSIQVDTLSN